MKSIALSLCDNDFHLTLGAMLDNIKLVLEYNPNLENHEIEMIVRASIKPCYLGFNPQSFNLLDKLDHTMNYLYSMKVLFDEDADNEVAGKDHGGGSAYFNVMSGTVFLY